MPKLKKQSYVKRNRKNVELNLIRRLDSDIKKAEQTENTRRRRALRENSDVRSAEQSEDTRRRRAVRENSEVRRAEQAENSRLRSLAREGPSVRDNEQKLNSEAKKSRRMELDAVKEFYKSICEGPTYVCQCCDGLFFKSSVKVLCLEKLAADVSKVLAKVENKLGKDFLCSTCHQSMTGQNPRIPKLCSANGLKFPKIPMELKGLTQLEERLVAGRIPFMQIRKLGIDMQCGIKGNVINVINPVNDTIQILPRQFNEASVVFLMMMRKMEYNHYYLFETIRPNVVYQAARLLAGTELYKEEGIVLSKDWLETMPNTDCVEFKTNADVNNNLMQPPKTLSEDKDTEQNPNNPGGQETLIVDSDLREVHKIAPGEGQRPLSLLMDKNAEALAFPSIYCGEIRQLLDPSITVKDIAKWEARCYDRRCAIPSKLLYSYRKTQVYQIANEISICLRKKKGGVLPSAGDLLDNNYVSSLLQHDDGFRFLKNVRSSPAYWQDRQKDLMAMIRQIGIPSLFITLSAAEVKWVELTCILVNIHTKKILTHQEAEELSWEEKADLIRKDPITCSRYFDYRLRQCKKYLFGKTGIFKEHPVKDFFWRIEFQHRGSPHMHGLFWLQDAPHFIEEDPSTFADCCNFIDKYINCTSEVQGVIHQAHKHTDCCKVTYKGETRCRFGMPYPPMDKTEILLPFPTDFCPSLWKKCKEHFKIIQQLAEDRHTIEPDLTFADFLDLVGLSRNQYIMAVRSSIIRPTVFLQRGIKDAFYNAFNPTLASAWKANMDIQFILDPYACCKYVAAYISKSNRGMSELLRNIVKEAEAGNLSVKDKLKAVGHTFLKGSEVSAQEAAYGVLGLPLTMASRDVVYINTSKPDDRVHLVKNCNELKLLPKCSTDVVNAGNIEHYSQRPSQLELTSLADFVALWTFSKKKPNHTEQSDQEHQEGDENEEEHFDNFDEINDEVATIIKTQGGWLKRRKKSRVVRMRNFGEKIDPEDFYREQVMLYWPWRNEQEDLLGVDCKDVYELHLEEINKVRGKYDKRVDLTKVEYFQEKEDDNLPDEFIIDNEYEVMHYDGVSQDFVDPDLGRKRHREMISLPRLMTDEEYHSLINKLNDRQRKYHNHIMESLSMEKTLYEYVEGGAGVGKSMLITAITQSIMRQKAEEVGKDPSRLSVLLCAPTGVAAFNIHGCTLHQAFCLPFGQNAQKMKCLSENVRNRLACEYKDVSLVICDEASMTSSDMQNQMDERMKQIFHSKAPFGGISVIQVGNFHQLPPVMGGYIFEDPKKGLAAISTNQLWPLFKLFELTECMRQKDDKQFAEGLNRLAIGQCTTEDIEMFQSRELKSHQLTPPESAIRLMYSNNDVDIYNQTKLAKMSSEGIIAYANDRVQGTGLQKHHEAIRRAVKTLPTKATQGLPSDILLKVGAHYMITVNIDTSDGLVNGAIGILKKITYGTTVGGRRVAVKVWLEFPNNVGKKLQKKTKCPENSSLVPLDQERRVVHSWPHRNLDVVRCQFPLVPAECITIHKSQGSTFKTAVVNVKYNTEKGGEGRCIARKALYVAFSRCTSLQGLFIHGEFKAPSPPEHDDPVMRELRRMRSNPVFTEDFIPFEENEKEELTKFKAAAVAKEEKIIKGKQLNPPKELLKIKRLDQREVITSRRVAQVGGHTLFESDIQTLNPRQWLNTKVVDAFLDLLSNASLGNLRNFHNFGEHFLSYLERHYDDVWTNDWANETNSELMAFPLCTNSHWTLFLVDRTKSLIMYFDSQLNFRNKSKAEAVKKFLQDADQAYNRSPVEWKIEEVLLNDDVMQKDTFNCGVFVCLFAKAYVEGIEFTGLPRGCRAYIRNCILTNNL